MYDEETCLHESGHSVAADALGFKVRLVTAEPGEHFSGVCRYLPTLVRDDVPSSVEAPFVAWPGGWQRDLGGKVVVALAGSMAVELFAPRGTAPVRLLEGVSEQAQERLEVLASASAAEVAEASEAVNSPAKTDAEQVAKVAYVAHGHDLLCSSSWLAWLAEECRALLLANEQSVRRLSGLLMAHGTIGEQAAAACLEGR